MKQQVWSSLQPKGDLKLIVGFTVNIFVVLFISNITDKQELTVILALFTLKFCYFPLSIVNICVDFLLSNNLEFPLKESQKLLQLY